MAGPPGDGAAAVEDLTRARLAALDWTALPRDAVVAALRPVLDGAEAARVLGRLLRAHPGWSGARRAVVAEAVLGVALWRRRLAFHARSEDAAALLDAFLAQLARPAQDAPPPDWPTRLSWPDALARELERALGPDEAARFAAACNAPGPVTVRANRARIDRDALAARLRDEGVESRPDPHAADALQLAGRPNVLGLAAHQAGLFEVQDAGSQLLGALVDARPGEHLLDLCAGAGGKTLLLAAALGGRGTVDAFDVDGEALERLRARAARAGVADVVRIHHGLPVETSDAVLVDAPCSSLGALRRGPDVRWRLDVGLFAAWPARQGALLETAAARVRPGGRIVYGTCTVRPEENGGVVAAFLGAHPDFRQVPARAPEAFRRGLDFVALPHVHGTDGFFGAVLERR